jgi:hypothetical protein
MENGDCDVTGFYTPIYGMWAWFRRLDIDTSKVRITVEFPTKRKRDEAHMAVGKEVDALRTVDIGPPTWGKPMIFFGMEIDFKVRTDE